MVLSGCQLWKRVRRIKLTRALGQSDREPLPLLLQLDLVVGLESGVRGVEREAVVTLR